MIKVVTLPTLLLIAFLVGLSSALFLMPFWIGPFITAAKNGHPPDWIGFAGNFAAGIMTLIAAIIAWFAVQAQINVNRELAGQTANQAEAAIREEASQLLRAFDELWKILDEFAFLPAWEQTQRAAWLSVTMFRLPPPSILDDLEKYGSKLGVNRLPRFDRFVVRLRMLYRSTTAVGEMDPAIAVRTSQIRILRDQMESLRFAAVEFAPEWRDTVFVHHREDVTSPHFTYADAIKSSYELMLYEEASDDDE